MFVCVCKGIRMSDLEALAKDKGHGPEVVKQLTGAGSECGTCELRLQRILKEMENSANSFSTEPEDAAG